jgi:outer membrane protein TolC
MRWKVVVAGLALSFAAVVGCKQQCFMTYDDWQHYRDIGVPASLECSAEPISPEPAICPKPRTILDPEAPPYYLTLREAVAMALEHGTVGNQNLEFTPLAAIGGAQGVQAPALTYLENLGSFVGRAFVGDDSIRAFAFDPAIIAAGIEGSLSKFDPVLTAAANWTTTDQPIASAAQAFQAGFSNVAAVQTQDATVSAALLKPLPTGGVAGITFTTTYELTNLRLPVNPAYHPTLQFQFEQPLLQGFGVEINQLRAAHPGSILTPFQQTNYLGVEGILITRLRFDEQRAEFERLVHHMVVNVELAYWTLYGTYWNLYSREQALRQAYEAWRILKAKYEAGRETIQSLAQARQQYELFRGQRLDALARVLDDERLLRGMMGLPTEDGRRLVPVDEPTMALYEPDWASALDQSLALRPELVIARQDLKFQQLNLINQKNLLMPDLRFTSTYDITAVGSHLGGGDSDPLNALSNLADNRFNNWALGLRLTVPLAYRDANAAVRVARLNLARSYAVLEAQELKAQRFLALTYRRIFESYEIARALRAQREAAAVQLDARFKLFIAGKETLDILLESQRVWADALRDEYQAIATYNGNLAGFEFAKGTILDYDHVVISEGPLPKCALVRAVDHEQERKKALVCRELALPVKQPVVPCEGGHLLGVPQLPTASAGTLPALFAGSPDVSSLPDHLPPVTSTSEIIPTSASSVVETITESGPSSSAAGSPMMVPAGSAAPGTAIRSVRDGRLDSVPTGASLGTIIPEQPVVAEPVRRP